MTALTREIVRLIEADGPLPLDRFMALCLGHPEHGYYMTRDPFGVRGDFVTAPEISQMFGELIAVWCAEMWSALGQPACLRIVELGPGRGTLTADLARAAAIMPGFAGAAEFHLVETSPALRARQEERLKSLGAKPCWHSHILDVPPGPALIIANEFFDALPVKQFERRDGTWFERAVGLDDEGELSLGLLPFAADVPESAGSGPAADGDVLEIAPQRGAYVRHLAERALSHPLYALFIDYGHTKSARGDTVQAVRGHRYCGITESPGDCDLTAHVDFEALAKAVRASGASVYEPMTQRQFLGALGIEARAERLQRGADAEAAEDVGAALARLTDCDQMGNLFKVLAISSPALPAPYPFAQETR